MEEAPWSKLAADLLEEILARVDGPTLASAACSCKDLRRAAEEEALWQELCHGTWPSTREAEAKKLVLSMPGGFARLYADSLPLLVCKPRQEIGHHGGAGEPAPATADLISFVDVYYKKKCVLSRVAFGVPLHDPAAGGFQPDVPFMLRVDGADGDEGTGAYPFFSLEPKEEGGVGVLSWMLEEDLTLSWVLVDAKEGRAVNLSGRKPSAVLRSPSPPGGEDIVVRFSCAVPVEPKLLPPDGVAKCVVSMGCHHLSQAEDDRLSCSEIELQVVDAEGAYLDGHRSLAVLQRALYSRSRTTNRGAAEDGCRAYLNGRREGWRWPEVAVGDLCAVSAVALLSLSGLCLLTFSWGR